jgi:hypothetical protein
MLPPICSPGAAAARSTATSSSGSVAVVHARKPVRGATGLSVDLAVAVVVQAQLDPGGVHVGIQAELADAWGALVAGAQCPRSKELAGGAAGEQLIQGRPVADAELAAVAAVELGRDQQTAVTGGGDGRLGRRLVDDHPVVPPHQVGGGSQVACWPLW